MRILAGHNLPARGMILKGHGLRGVVLPAALRALDRMFPGMRTGTTHYCTEPLIVGWAEWVEAQAGTGHSCSEPLPGITPESGPWAEHDCEEALL